MTAGARNMPRSFLRVLDLTPEELRRIVYLAQDIKRSGVPNRRPLEGKTVGMIFDKSSTRTRVSFEVGIGRLGGRSIYLTRSDLQIGRGETIEDTARVLSRFLDGVVIRTFGQDLVERFAEHAHVPVINALTDEHHPCQALADFQTIIEKKGDGAARLAYVGDGNNVAHSLIEAGVMLGFQVVLACPEGHTPDPDIVDEASAAGSGSVTVVRDPFEAVDQADVVYTDTWVSMGQEEEENRRVEIFQPYQVNKDLLSRARPDVIVMHCLPAHRGHEITNEVMDGPRSVVFDQAENRLYSQMALMEFLIG